MKTIPLLLNAALIAACAWEVPIALRAEGKPKAPVSVLWNDRGDIASLDLTYGSGGKEHRPAGPFTFVKEDKNGTSPKFEIVDAQGVSWKAKLGEETKAETAAASLMWAVGYFTDDDYYLPQLQVAQMPKLKRGGDFVSADGLVRGVRLERIVKGQKKTVDWSWFKNPFVGTKEFNGLRVMMALMNNWDLKDLNNAVYEVGGAERYVISDLGATFGQTGNTIVRSKSNLDDYREANFIEKIGSKDVDFTLSSRPLAPLILNVPYYHSRTKMQEIAKDIPIADAKWVGRLLNQLSIEQIRDCFQAAGYSLDDAQGFAIVIKGRIAELNKL